MILWFDNVFLFTAYESLESREETRNSAWLKEGWDSNVYYTGRAAIRARKSGMEIETSSMSVLL